jgi:hypothetical protein
MNLRNWLKKTPRPAVVLADDKRIDVPNNHRAINDLVATVEALEPSKLSCLDRDGNVIRSISLESVDDKPSSAASPEMSDLQLFAKLLAEGYENGRKANQPIIDSAMSFVERQGQRLAKAESEIERLRLHIHKLNGHIAEMQHAPVAEAEGSSDDSIMGAIVAGAMQGALGVKPPVPAVTPLKNGARKQ